MDRFFPKNLVLVLLQSQYYCILRNNFFTKIKHKHCKQTSPSKRDTTNRDFCDFRQSLFKFWQVDEIKAPLSFDIPRNFFSFCAPLRNQNRSNISRFQFLFSFQATVIRRGTLGSSNSLAYSIYRYIFRYYFSSLLTLFNDNVHW